MTRPASPSPRRRLGFTLIELLVVIIIIAILIALLVPAVMRAFKTAKAAAVQAEINTLASALADFKSKFGDYPPSRIMVSEFGVLPTLSSSPVTSGASADITVGQLATRSLIAFRKFWPRVAFSSSLPAPTLPVGAGLFYDFNGDGTQATVPTVLQGHECLVFFLGGIPLYDSATGTYGMTGFAKNPSNPFLNSLVNTPNYSGNRNPPLFEFNAGRLKATNYLQPNPYGSAVPSGIPGYIDSLNSQQPAQSFYAYFSNNMGTGYDPNDFNYANVVVNTTEVDSFNAPIGLNIKALQPVFGGAGQVAVTLSPSPNPYTSGSPATPAYINAQSFQIISPGIDGAYGVGGVYLANTQGSDESLPREDGNTAAGAAPFPFSPSTDIGLRNIERDNLTNFHQGQLQ